MRWYRGRFQQIEGLLGRDLLDRSCRVEVPTWHAIDVRGQDHLISYELMNVSFETRIPPTAQDAVLEVEPQMPWAEDHFDERVSGKPLNPPPSAARWQAGGTADKHRTIPEEGVMKYSHTYPERFWPKEAGTPWYSETTTGAPPANLPHWGIRFKYGDLEDVVQLLRREPLTRQAYLPVWFPEDTGAVHGERVPCTLGYHFMVRDWLLHVTYMIRSVDFVRHFRDDVYLAMRLAQWMRDRLNDDPGSEHYEIGIGKLVMHIMSLHYFAGDLTRMERLYGDLVFNETD